MKRQYDVKQYIINLVNWISIDVRKLNIKTGINMTIVTNPAFC